MKHSLDEIRSALSCQTGTSHYWRVSPFKNAPVITDGVKTMADMCESYWLVDNITSHQLEEKIRNEEFQVWKLERRPDDTAVLTCEDGNNHVLLSEKIGYTDFPLPEGIKLYLDNGVLLLPSEY